MATHTRKARIALVAALLSLPGGLLACGGESDDVGEAGPADAKTELTVYSGRQRELVEPLLDRFGTENGIKMQIRYGDTAALASQIREEGRNSPADVFFSQDAGALGALEKENLLSTLPGETLRNVKRRFRSRQDFWVGTSARARIIAYDPREISAKDLPQSILNLTAPRWKGKVGWSPTNASFQAFVTGLRKLKGDARAERWLKDMVANDTRSYPNNIAVRDAIATGEIQAGLINHYYVAEAYAEEGRDYPVKIFHPAGGDAGSLINVAGAGVLKSSGERAAALKLVQYLVSRDAQRYFARETKEYPVAGEVEADTTLTPLSELRHPDVDLSDLNDLKGTLELIEGSGAL